MPDTIKGKRDYLERAAKAYAEFKQRTDTNPMLTREEKSDRLEAFLDAHVSVFDDYFLAWGNEQTQKRAAGKKVQEGDGLPADAQDMAEDIAAVFPESATRDYYNRNSSRDANLQHYYYENRGKLLFGASDDSDSRTSYSETARVNFEKQQQATSGQPSPAVQAEKAQAEAARLQAEVPRLQAQALAASAAVSNARSGAGMADAAAEDHPGDEFYDKASKQAWDAVTKAEQEETQAQTDVANAVAELAKARAELAEAKAALARTQASKISRSRAQAARRQLWADAAQAAYDQVNAQAVAADDQLEQAMTRAANAQRAADGAEERERKALQEAEAARRRLEQARKAMKKNPSRAASEEAEDARIDQIRSISAAAKARDELAEKDASLAALPQANQNAAQAKAARDQARIVLDRELSPVTLRRRQRQELNRGMTARQQGGLRDICAFLVRNTLHGQQKDNRRFTGAFVDGVISRPPLVKLVAFYLIENKKLHEKLDYQKLLDIQASYIPKLEDFKKQIFNGVLGGFFGRAKGEGLDWDKLSDAVHSAEEMLTAATGRLLLPGGIDADTAAGQFSAAAANRNGMTGQNAVVPPLDPQLGALLQTIANKGMTMMSNPQPTREAAQDLENAIKDFDAYLSGIDKSRLDKTKAWFYDKDYWNGYIRKSLKITGGILSPAGEMSSTGAGVITQAFGIAASWDAIPFSLFSTLISGFTAIGSIADIFTSGNVGFEKAKDVMRAFKDVWGASSSVYGDVRSIAGLVDTVRSLTTGGKVAWLSGGVGIGFAAAGAIGVGTLSTIQGLYHIVDAQGKRIDLETYLRNLNGQQPGAGLTQAQQEEFETQKQMLLNVATAMRQNETRRLTSGVFQSISGTLQVASGIAMAFSGGTAAIVSAGLSGIAFVVSIAGAITDYKMKRAHKKDVIDRYIGMDELYSDFRTKRKGAWDPEGFKNKYGSEDEIKYKLRKTAEAYLGFPSDDKMHAHIMWRYAQALYKGAFLKEGGASLTAAEANDPQEQQKRFLFTDLLKKSGMEVKYPASAGEQPSPDINTIYKKLMS